MMASIPFCSWKLLDRRCLRLGRAEARDESNSIENAMNFIIFDDRWPSEASSREVERTVCVGGQSMPQAGRRRSERVKETPGDERNEEMGHSYTAREKVFD